MKATDILIQVIVSAITFLSIRFFVIKYENRAREVDKLEIEIKQLELDKKQKETEYLLLQKQALGI